MPNTQDEIYREDLVDIELNSGSLHRSFLNHSLGEFDNMANRFGVRLFRDGEPVNVLECECEGIFMAPDGTNIGVDNYGFTGINGIWVQLPSACYTQKGQFSLAIRVVNSNGTITGTMRIIDGVVNKTGADDVVVPTSRLPTTTEILDAFNEWQEVTVGAVRWDITQAGIIDAAGQAQARTNIDAQQELGLYIDGDGYICQEILSDV